MGIFDAFNKDKDKVKGKAAEIKEEVKAVTSKNEAEVKYVKESYILTQERCSELLQRIFNDSDHGKSMMEETSLPENIFVLGYIENSILPDLKNKGNEKDYMWFYSSMTIFRKIFYDKIMNAEKLWKVMLKTTKMPFLDRGCEHILVCDQYSATIEENLKKIRYDVEIVEISNEEFKNELNDLYRNGYKGMCFSDGMQRPYYFSKERIAGLEEKHSPKFLVNPETQYCMTAFFQEMRRNVNYKGADKIRHNLENAMVNSIMKTRFVVPAKKSNVNNLELPVYMSSEDNDTVTTGVYIFTDKYEADALKKINDRYDDGWDLYSYDFDELMNLLNETHINEIRINFGSVDFRVNEKSLKLLKNQHELMQKEIAEKKEEWESVELPKMIKDKNVPAIKDSNGTIVFARKYDSVMVSKFIFEILEKRNMKKEIMQFFFNDDSLENLTLYDFDFRCVTLKLKKEQKNSGLFVMPMRYDDEKEGEAIEDQTLHHTVNAAKIKEGESVQAETRTMHFYTIENKDTKKRYIPLFSNEKEAEKIYARDKFCYCLVSYEDIQESVKPYDGIVINPASMSFILEKDLLVNVFDINNKF
ncbi:SseB family protein [uncultured Clostridium sp.]|uniref:SseB family protein n=1 Tax=uncultured Clostridium sp. TaxID=59620 RepID=UPI0025E0831C|nr:SseB family protein [uncultured Clostridium sp.]